ncbi:formyltetrahydrofolate deformylase [Sphingomonas jeddahensis]|uniref:Formyltetrahydrofolate deformylase n=1 Tax=Sphingomonas jeddahensis TaxID=1915074 RepID=A0A1V2F012_9SPHN|nr:formyltetrahydrofolate deformylase [Sphingomonas jeddahensis]ONF97734.1 Formyltetrahydrofolate deformylase [Sphingomonas jeddahensis]
MAVAEHSWILTFSCQDRSGIVAAVTGCVAQADGFILDSQQYADLETGRFFMRLVFTGGDMHEALAEVAARFGFDWTLVPADHRPKVVIACSTTSHCLNDLLHRWSIGALPIDPVAVVSNHETLRGLAEWHGVPFHHLPVSAANRAEQERAMLQLFDASGAELLVLARYMQVLSPDLVAAVEGRCVNIHHSFLPSFKGAKPYHQAHARGVKLIGATAHFVTTALDEGPIIEQAAERVDHRATADEFIAIGRDIEAQVLARAVRWIAERRVLANGARTVVFR